MLKKTAACLMILALLMGCTAFGEEGSAVAGQNSLTVGNVTQMTGEFFLDAWGNATSDYDVKDLLHGYDLVLWDATQGRFDIDHSVVSGIAVVDNEQQDRSYVLMLQHDLFFSDGTPVTAWDYAFSFLIRIAPEIMELGGKPDQCQYLMGYEEYISRTAETLSGIRVTSDDTMIITVNHEALPFFYELGLLQCRPYPIHVIAPGVAVHDDGNGVYLANADETQEEPLFTVDLLRRTLCDPETGYRSHPSVVSGPYTLKSWDGTTAEFEINPYYKGNVAGKKPQIQHLTYTLAENESMISDLLEGRFGLLNKVMNTQSIQAGIGGVGSGEILMTTYPRVGLSYLSFCCEQETVSSPSVRQAIAWCLDRDRVVQDYVGSFGVRSDGYYGVGQWMYGILNGTIDIPEEEGGESAAWEDLSLDGLTVYQVDLDQARQLLENDGWKLNAQGIREKMIDNKPVSLELKMVYPEGNGIADTLATCLVPNLELVGIRLTMEPASMPELLAMFYRQQPRDADLFYLASNFALAFDPSLNFQEENGEQTWYYTGYSDQQLYELAADLRRTEAGNILEYCKKWIAFQERFNRMLPMLPLYTNVYFDFYTNALHDYSMTENVTWSKALLGAYLDDSEE